MLCEQRGAFMFQLRPDLFPPYMTHVERNLWGMYYADKADKQSRAR